MIGRFAAARMRVDLPKLTAGVVLTAAFFALSHTANGIEVQFVPPWDRSVPGELYFWLGAVFFLLPGSALVGAGIAPLLASALARVTARLDAADARDRRLIVFSLAAIAWSIARLGNQLVLHGQPFTDDEDAARFGGQVLATGSLWAPLPPMRHAFPELFLFQRDGHWTSFEFLGALLPWTFAELTGSGTLVFSLFAGIAPAAIACATMRREGTTAGLATGALLLLSPMALTLSLTSHTHVVSRGLLALGFGLLLFVDAPGFRRSFAAGMALGLSFATRPAETTLLLLPLVLVWLREALVQPSARARVWGLLLGAAPAIIALFAYDYALTGSLGFPRNAANEISAPYGSMLRPPFELARLWPRFGNNFAYNTLTLAIWFLGPLGLLLAALGVGASRLHRLLATGVLLDLCLTLLHDDRGLHMVGPIHLSELAVPLCILAGAGIARVLGAVRSLNIDRNQVAIGLFAYVVCGLTTFAAWHGRALHVQALARLTITSIAEDVPARPAIVLASPYGAVSAADPTFGQTGGFMFEWRRARPDLSEPVLIVHDSPEARAEVLRAFPRRTAYVFDPTTYGWDPVRLDALLNASAKSNAKIAE